MSEQKYLKSFFANWWKYWLLTILVGLLAGYLATSRLGPKYQGVILFTINNKPVLVQKDAPFYLYDGYYNKQASIAERNNLANWLLSSKTVYDIYTQAGLMPPAKSAESLSQEFQVSDILGTEGANTVNLVTTSKSEDEAKRLSKAVVDYTRDNYISDTVSIEAHSPLVLEVPPATMIILLGMTLGLTFMVFIITLIVHYFREGN